MNSVKALYAAYISYLSSMSLFLTWECVNRIDDAHRARRSAMGWDYWDHPEKAEHVAERDAVIAKHHAAVAEKERLAALLVDALWAAEWGRQSDGSFVTDRRYNWSGARIRALWIDRCPVIEHVTGLGRHEAGPGLVVRTLHEAAKIRDAAKAWRREAQYQYAARQAVVLNALRRGARLAWRDGQEGGVVYTPSGEHPVSLNGVRRVLAAEGFELKTDGDVVYVPGDYDNV